MSTNTSVNILQYHDCQINAKRRKDKMHQCLYPSSIMVASHWFIQTTCLDDYQLSPKRFMIVSYITGIERSTLGPLWKKSDFDQPLKSQVKPSEADASLEFQRQSGSVRAFWPRAARLWAQENTSSICRNNADTFQRWDLQIDLWPAAHLPEWCWQLCTQLSSNSVGNSEVTSMTWNDSILPL